MKVKSAIFCIIILMAISLSLGVACAGENISSTHPELLSVEESPIDVESEPVEIDNDVSTTQENEILSSSDDGDNADEIQNDEILSVTEEPNFEQENDESANTDDNEILSAGEGSFTELQNLINSYDEGSTIRLYKDYSYIEGDSKDGIVIGKDLIIYGQGHVLNGKNLARIFKITSGNVVLKNLKFIDANCTQSYYGNSDDYWFSGEGSAIYLSSKSNLKVENCGFENSSFGGAIYTDAINYVSLNMNPETKVNTIEVRNSYFKNGFAYGGGAIQANILKIYDSEFVNNYAEFLGGAIYCDYLTLENSIFNNNTVYTGPLYSHYGSPSNGGAIHVSYEANISNSIFTNNFARYGGAIYAPQLEYYENGQWNDYNSVIKIDNCLFKNNHAVDSGGALYIISKLNCENSIFDNNSAYMQGGAIYSATSSINLNNCEFTNSNATFGGAISAINIDKISNTKFISNNANLGKNIIYNSTKDTSILDLDGIAQFISHSKFFKISDIDHVYTSVLSDNHTIFFYYNDSDLFKGKIYPFPYAMEFFLDDGYSMYGPNSLYMIADISKINDNLQLLSNYYLSIGVEKDFEEISFTKEKWEELKSFQVNKILSQYNLKESGLIPDQGYSILINDTTRIFIDFEILQSELSTTHYIKGLGYFRFWIPAYQVRYQNIVENITVEKNASGKEYFVNDEIPFEITVSNVGNEILNEVFIEDVDFTSNILYLRYENGTGNWIYSSEPITASNSGKTINARWILTTPLNVGENVTIKLIFKANNNGTATNNVTVGFKNIVVSNDTEDIKIYKPNLTVQKITNNPKVEVGSRVSFDIIVTNTGDYDLTGVFVEESSYYGLTYDTYSGDKWIKEANIFYLNDTLGIGQSENFTVYFYAYEVGNWTNIVIAGSNQTENKTANNTTEVINKTDVPENETPENNTDVPEETPGNNTVVENDYPVGDDVDLRNDYAMGPVEDNDTPTDESVSENKTLANKSETPQNGDENVKVDKNATGNPIFLALFVLFAALITLRRRD